jgi:hypothetical protein
LREETHAMATKRKVAKKKSKPARRRSASPKMAAQHAVSVATSPRYSVRERTAAAAETPLAVCENEKDMQAMLALLRNTDEPVKVRLAALQSLQAASFSVLAFEACRGDYIATLRKIADDPIRSCASASWGSWRARRTGMPRRSCSKDCTILPRPCCRPRRRCSF